jgi:hypothetical protein
MLFRHWTLYDAMYHSSYVASKLGIWKERGRKRLTGLLAKMGFVLTRFSRLIEVIFSQIFNPANSTTLFAYGYGPKKATPLET